MYKSIRISNYKNLNIKLANLKRINLIIGPNNSGKTNLLKCLTLMSNVVTGSTSNYSFSNVINSLGGSQTVNKANSDSLVKIRFDLSVSQRYRNTTYEIEYKYPPNLNMPNITKEAYFYTEKTKSNKDTPYYIFNCHDENPGMGLFTYYETTETSGQTRRDLINVSQHETIINQITKMASILNRLKQKNGIDKVVDLKNYFANSHFFSMARFAGVNDIRIFNKTQMNLDKLNIDGSNFSDCLYRICFIENSDRKKIILERLLNDLFGATDTKLYFKDTDGVIIPCLKIKYKESFETKLIGELSDGTLKLLFMALMLIDNNMTDEGSGIVAIDEPETNLHPAWIDIFGNWLLENKFGKQIFISTHSPELLDTFTKGYINDDVAVIIIQPSGYVEMLDKSFIIDPISKNYGLGDLYRAGSDYVGGWPCLK